MSIVQIEGLTKRYSLGGMVVLALDNVSLAVDEGEFLALAGPSGSGKSTLLNMITGVDRPTAGEVRVAGTPLHELDENRLAIWRGTHVGVVFQFFQLLPALTLLQNVVLPMDFVGRLPAKERRAHAEALLARVGLTAHADQLPGTVSGGQQQRAAIARALANDPHVILADEPTGNLDSTTGQHIMELLRDLNRQGKTIIIVTHEPDVAAWAAHRMHMKDGVIDQIDRS